MKQSSLTARLLKIRQAAHPRAPEAGPNEHAGPARDWVAWKSWPVVLCITLTAGATYAVLYFAILSKIPHPMVGTWIVNEVTSKQGEQGNEALKGGRLIFHRDGTMIGETMKDSKPWTIKATVEVEGKFLRITSVHPETGEAVTDVQRIRTLADDKFVIEDRTGTVLNMARLIE